MPRKPQVLFCLCCCLIVLYIFTQVWSSGWRSAPPRQELEAQGLHGATLGEPRKDSSGTLEHSHSHQGYDPGQQNRTTGRQPDPERIINLQRHIIAQELADYPFQDGSGPENLLMESGGSPLRSLVITTWRSGSTFIGDVLNSLPSMFYHYEPLMDFGIRRLRHGVLMDRAVNNIKRLFSCDYSDLGRYIAYSQTHTYVFLHNWRLWRYCDSGRHSFCWRADFLSRFCRLFPFQTAKTVRLPLNATEPLLSALPGLRLLLLVRDPRGTLQSRRHRNWCPGQPDCDDPGRLCADLESDYWAAVRLAKRYSPGRLRVVRYEDFSFNVNASVPALLKFAGFHYHPVVQQFLRTHTTTKKGGVSSTYRDSSVAPLLWARSLTWSQVRTIQSKCVQAMKLWGYRTITSEEWETANRNDSDLGALKLVDTLELDNLL